jgi:iron-sulfur cluster assembly accessory protein
MINDEKREDGDLVFSRDGVSVISDEISMEMINGSCIEYKEEMIRSAFEVCNNPLAEGGCSCGTSFTPKQ